jgi:hypothetical protein
MTAPKLAGAGSSILGALWIASTPAFAYHETTGHVAAPIGAIIPIVIAVVVGVIVLSFWKPQSRNAKVKKRERSPGYRAAHKRHKRGR